MNSQIDWKLILRYLSDSLTSEEQQRFNRWVESDFENQRLLKLITAIWQSQEEPSSADLEKAWQNLASKAGISILPARLRPLHGTDSVGLPPRRHRVRRVLRYAAIVFMVVSGHLAYKAMQPASLTDETNEMQEIYVEYGKTASLSLQDGTKITLDAGTTLSYPKNFGEGSREIFLDGEAFFKVTPNSQKPFVINANQAVVQVVGTEFNVKAWSQNPSVRVAVAKGSVSLRSASNPETEAVLINRGQFSALLDHHMPTRPVEVDIRKHIAWLKRELVLENTALSEVLNQLERWYHLEFKLPTPFYKSVRISGVIKKKPINDIIEAIAMMINLESRREGNLVVFMEKSP